MKKYFIGSIIIIQFIIITSFCYNYKIVDYVPDAETAKRIAEAIWLPIYGEEVLEEKPYNAELVGKVWIVTGTMNEIKLGGVAYIEIQKNDCKILRVDHGK